LQGIAGSPKEKLGRSVKDDASSGFKIGVRRGIMWGEV